MICTYISNRDVPGPKNIHIMVNIVVHNVAVMNKLALEKTIDVWPGFIAAANAMTSLTENGGDRGLIGGVLNDSGAWVTTVFPPRVPRDMYRGWLKKVMEHYAEAGLTMISSSIENGRTLTAFYEILREEQAAASAVWLWLRNAPYPTSLSQSSTVTCSTG